MPLGLMVSSLGRAMRRKRLSSLDILSSKRAPRDYYKGKNCKPTGFHTRKGSCAFAGGYVIVDEKLPRFVVPDLTDFKVTGRKGLFFGSHFTLNLHVPVRYQLRNMEAVSYTHLDVYARALQFMLLCSLQNGSDCGSGM
ncbi:hypothetical protein BAE44_0014632 [Dichanthelium oligosanthes]|uniref:Uncharacterized protein n=1 Tax=Dichanthelium oligosanthes TaxID=888268 RepID=A0A1E5VGU4_9POAL|nr:hypothetical protein BAE44_0014632 [Dichanthelium oligosanthes]